MSLPSMSAARERASCFVLAAMIDRHIDKLCPLIFSRIPAHCKYSDSTPTHVRGN